MSAGLADQNPLMVETFAGVYLIRLDTDEWGWENVSEFGDVPVIPVFYRLDVDGHPTGDSIDGGAWGPDTYENIANTMGPWFHQP